MVPYPTEIPRHHLGSISSDKKRNRRQVSNRLIRRTLQKTDITGAYSKSLTELQTMLDQAFRAYKVVNADTLRDNFLPDLAQARSEHFGTQYETELQQLLQTEQQRKMSKAIKRMRNKLSKPPTTQVFVTENATRRLVTTKDDLEQVCINQKRSSLQSV